jgi:C-terminal processing protease CtpA/Prc
MTVDGPQLDTISQEVGMPLDGLVGGTFLREFFVTVDYQARLLHFRRYANRDHIVDEFVRVGLTLTQGGNGYVIDQVHPNTDAAALQLQPGDEVRAISGMQLASLDPVTASALLLGAAGEQRALTMGATAVAAIANTTLQVKVEDLLHY